LDKIWKWIGFSRKDNAKVVLKKNFIENIDYKISLLNPQEQDKNDKKTNGGKNKETIMMNINTFKKFCLKAGTKKADDIHDYYIKLEELLHEITNEES
jgi:phage anti-repressor protein